MPEQVITLRLDAEDLALLDGCAATEKLTRSDILRRGLRRYAAELGVKATAHRRAPKPKRK